MKRILLVAATLLLAASLAQAEGSLTGDTTLHVEVGPEAAIVVSTGITNLTSVGIFADYTGTTNLIYRIRNSADGTGKIELQVTVDFPGNGPKVGDSGTTGDTLTYTATVSDPGVAAAPNQEASTTVLTSVATFPNNARSAKAGNTASVLWALVNDPAYPVGTYNATVTFTISQA